MKVLTLLRLFISSGLILILCAVYSYPQGPKRPKTDDPKPDPGTSSGPKRPKSTGEEVKTITRTEFRTIVAKPNKGYLSVVAVTSATVALIPINQKGSTINEIIKDKDGTLNLINLVPGTYNIVIEHEDYEPYSETRKIEPGLLDTIIPRFKMVSKYGAIRIGGAPPDAKIYLDDKLIGPSRMTQDNQNIVIPKIPVKKYNLKITKSGLVDFTQEIDVTPGREQFVTFNPELATVTLDIISLAGTRVYVGNEEKGAIPSDGKWTIPLPPGRHTVRLSKDGYQEWKKELTLSLANNPVTERAVLVPIPNSTEAMWEPTSEGRKWYPQSSEWRFNNSGAVVRGEKVVLFNTESNRDFNVYTNFILEFDVALNNAKSVAWVARAKDPDNYYLFEIGGLQGNNPTFHFWICKNGKLDWKDSQPFVEKYDKRIDSFHIIFEARGNQFQTSVKITSAPLSRPQLIGIFNDNTFSYGGVGFRGKDQSEVLLQKFFVFPRK